MQCSRCVCRKTCRTTLFEEGHFSSTRDSDRGITQIAKLPASPVQSEGFHARLTRHRQVYTHRHSSYNQCSHLGLSFLVGRQIWTMVSVQGKKTPRYNQAIDYSPTELALYMTSVFCKAPAWFQYGFCGMLSKDSLPLMEKSEAWHMACRAWLLVPALGGTP